MPTPFAKPCIKCGLLFKNGGSLCPECTGHRNATKEQNPERKQKKRFLYGGNYTIKAQAVRDTATHCYLCGKQFKPGEPIQADHMFPELGNQSPLAPTHPSCNRMKSNHNINQAGV